MMELGYSEQETIKMIKDAEAIAKHMKVDANNNLSFDSNSARDSGIDEKLIAQTETDMTIIQRVGLNNSLACSGYTGVNTSFEIIFLNDCHTRQIAIYIAGGAAVTSNAAAIIAITPIAPAAAVLGSAAALIGFGSAYIALINRGYGISIFYGRSPIEIHAQ